MNGGLLGLRSRSLYLASYNHAFWLLEYFFNVNFYVLVISCCTRPRGL